MINIIYSYFFLLGQSYEIRMLDNRKLGELPEINGKLVKVKKKTSTDPLWINIFSFLRGLVVISHLL